MNLRAIEARILAEREQRMVETRGKDLPKSGPDVRRNEIRELSAETQRQLAMRLEVRRARARQMAQLLREGANWGEVGAALGLSRHEVDALRAFAKREGIQ